MFLQSKFTCAADNLNSIKPFKAVIRELVFNTYVSKDFSYKLGVKVHDN